MSTKGYRELDDDPRLTAYALGELEGDEAAEIEAMIARDARARALVDELRGTAGWIGEQLASEGAPELTETQRRAIVARASATRRGGRRLSTRTLIAIGVFASAATALVVTQMWVRPEESAPYLYNIFGGGDGGSASVRRLALPSARPDGPGYLGDGATLRMLGSTDTADQQGYIFIVGGVGLQGLGYVHDLDGESSPGTESYDLVRENDFQLARDTALSTFSIDVDTASYSNVRRFLSNGMLPPPDAVRIEELVNYFPYDDAGPTDDRPFAVHVEVAGCPWAPRHRIVRIGLAGRELGAEGRKPSNLVFLLDVSGSMNSPEKLPLLKRALQLLVQELDERDRVAIVVYAGAAGLVLPSTSASEKWQILEAIERLHAGGSTAGGAGIELAYEVAREHFLQGGTNRVLLATDGDFNVGVSDDASLVRLIEEQRASGVFLSVLGFGTGNVKDSKLEKLADNGNGSYAYVDSLLEAQKVLVEGLGATLETIAKDVKIQVEFNPLEVEAYRLLGYENRLLAAQDFADDQKDAGEIGAGHTVTALYELVPAGQGIDVPGVDRLRYQTPATPSGQAFSGELMHLKLRYKQPDGDASALLEFPVRDEGGSFFEASTDLRFASSVAAFGMLLRGSKYAGAADYSSVLDWATESLGADPGGYREAFLALVRKAAELAGR